jgi:hypothetical protein
MERLRGHNPIALALWANAVLLALILAVIVSRANSPSIVPQALAQYQQPIAGGSGIYIMPGQFSEHTWGCYLLDVDTQTLAAYQFNPGETQLRLIAARNFRFDRKLGKFNTTPDPSEVADLVKKEQQAGRVVGSVTNPNTPEISQPKDVP